MSSEPAPAPSARPSGLPYAERINIIASDEPFKWLTAGWRDFRKSGAVSVAYGLIFVAAGFLLTVGLALTGLEYLIGPLIAGFMLVGPVLTVGFYAISRDLEAGRPASFARAIAAWRANPVPLLGLGLALVLFLVLWMRLAVLTFAVSFPYLSPTEQAMEAALLSPEGVSFLIMGSIVGAVMATIAFVTNVVALPLMLDQRADLVQAVVLSVVAAVLNARVMAVWAGLIVLFTAAGLITGYVGLCVTLPLIGHATWHAYRTIVRPPTSGTEGIASAPTA